MFTKINAIVLKENFYLEKDKIITVLTDNFGVIRIFVPNFCDKASNNFFSTKFLDYSNFVIFKKRSSYVLKESKLVKSFFKISDCKLNCFLTVNYICDILTKNIKENTNTVEILKLVLNSIYALTTNKFDEKLVRSVFELRLISFLGYTPNLVRCKNCGCIDFSEAYFSLKDLFLICAKCAKSINSLNKNNYIKINLTTIKALNYILHCDIKKMYSLKLSEKNLNLFSAFTHKYLKLFLGSHFKTCKYL